MKRATIAGLGVLLAATGVARADCDHFKWSVARELASFKQGSEAVDAGATMRVDRAYAITLKPSESAGFVLPPERAPKAGTFGGVLKLDAVNPAGAYDVTLSDEAWVDVIQNNAHIKSTDFSGQKDCPGVRKSVRFRLAAGPAIIQISNAAKPAINLAIAPAP